LVRLAEPFEDVQTLLTLILTALTIGIYSVYGGNWGKLNKGGEMYKNFDVKRHASGFYDLKSRFI
jgi:hypothetical protein